MAEETEDNEFEMTAPAEPDDSLEREWRGHPFTRQKAKEAEEMADQALLQLFNVAQSSKDNAVVIAWSHVFRLGEMCNLLGGRPPWEK